MSATEDAAGQPFYIVAEAAPSLERSRVLRNGDSFALLDTFGDIPGDTPSTADGLFHAGTRHLSRAQLTFSGKRLLLLSSHVSLDNGELRVDLSNADLLRGDQIIVPRGSLHLKRALFLWNGCLYEHVRLLNYFTEPIGCRLSFEYDADFADIFEVRGIHRARRGEPPEVRVDGNQMVFTYRGLDGKERLTQITFARPPTRLLPKRAEYFVNLVCGMPMDLNMVFECRGPNSEVSAPLPPADATALRVAAHRAHHAHDCHIYTANEQFNQWTNRSISDIRLMLNNVPTGVFPLAGVPWFSTEFGRDSILTALETLWFNPRIARGVLGFLAATQAHEVDAFRAAEPGKILHEMRRGEMAELGEVPFGRYYGSVDATPLFVLLAAEYLERTGDIPFIESIWRAIVAALAWIDQCGDADGDGFVEYRDDATGLRNQGWKDSADAIFHNSGALAEGPIALCEVQGYVYAAKIGAARMARILGHADQGDELERAAAQLKQRFESQFWSDKLGLYALALDKDKRPCEVATSNALQCLFTGIASPQAAKRMAQRALEPDFFSGWGVRTLAADQVRFNPMSYHNGSVWPHDNAIIALGLARYGFAAEAARILGALLDVSIFVPLARLPELICGFERRADEGPTLYPVACSPQAWSAGAVFMGLQAILGMTVRANPPQIVFERPCVPQFLQDIGISNLLIDDAQVDLRLCASDGPSAAVSATVTRQSRNLQIIVRT